MKYDVKKMRADIKAAEEKNRAIRPIREEAERLRDEWLSSWRACTGDQKTLRDRYYAYCKEHPEWDSWVRPHFLTLLYSARAHHRGRLHMKKQWVQKNGKHELVHYTMEDQAKLLEGFLDRYARPEGVEPSSADLIRVAALPLS
jgi:hypothetical protein